MGLSNTQRLTPWQRIGTDIHDCHTSSEAIAHAGMNWTVSRHRLYMTGPDGLANEVQAYAICRDDNGERIAEHVGRGFMPIQNSDAFGWFDDFIASGEVRLQTAGQTRGGERVWIFAQINREPEMITQDDALQQFLLLSNCHSSRGALRVGFVGVHLNRGTSMGVYSRTSSMRLLRIRHTRNGGATLAAAANCIDAVAGTFKVQCDRYRELARSSADSKLIRQYITNLFRLSDPKGNISPRGNRVIDSVLRRIDDSNPSWWQAYLAVCDHLNHEHGQKKSQEKRVDSVLFGHNNNLAVEGLGLAEEFIASMQADESQQPTFVS